MNHNINLDESASGIYPKIGTEKVYFSCPKFTVLLVVKGTTIVYAAPIVKTFERQTIGALTAWAQKKFGGPIIVKKLSYLKRGRT